MSRPPQVAVVGCGRWGRNLVRTFHELGALRLVVDTAPAEAKAMAEEYDVLATDLETALDDPLVDAVVVVVPAAQHVAVARQAIEAGKHVFVEKPLALHLEEAEQLCALADDRGRILMVGHLMRYHPAFAQLEAMVRAGALGSLRYVYANRLNLGRIRREEDVLRSFAPHDVSMILALVGIGAAGGPGRGWRLPPRRRQRPHDDPLRVRRGCSWRTCSCPG